MNQLLMTELSYRKITENIVGKLNLLEAYLFYCLALNSDCYTNKSYIDQEKLTMFYGIKDDDQIREWLHKFERLGLLDINTSYPRGKYGKFPKCSYILSTEHYVLISNKLYNEPISRELKGFLILFKCKCYNGTNHFFYSQTWLAEEIGMAKSTVSRHIQKAKELGYIDEDKKSLFLTNDKMFIITKETEIAKMKNYYPSIITDEDLRDGYIHS